MSKTFIKIKLLPPLKNYETMKNDENEQYYYDLKKINVEWCAQNNYYDLKKKNVEWITTSKK